MVATTFAADTPLAVTELVANHGIAGNWLWWNMVMSGLLTVFLFARLWRRAEVLTDVEFTELRYSGKPAAILRGFRALYLALPINLIIFGWVTLAMVKIIELSIGVDKWIAVGICVLVLYPNLEDKQTGYILVLLNHLPSGFKGLLLASFAAAFMSTVSTQLNWGSSYLINDFYKRFIKKNASPQHYVKAARWATVGIVLGGALVTSQMESVAGAWKFLLALGAGTGAVYILRWFWWRINAWSEISAMTASFVVSIFLQLGLGMDTTNAEVFAKVMLITVGVSTVVWITVTLLTEPEKEETLIRFYLKVRPGGGLWKPIASKAPDIITDKGLGWDLLDWAVGSVLVYTALFGIGKIILGFMGTGLLLLFVSIICFLFIKWELNRRGWPALKENEKVLNGTL